MTPIDYPCMHYPSDEERIRDRAYLGCDALPGMPCVWAKRFDGVQDPCFHSERIAAVAEDGTVAVDAAQIALDAGLV